MIIDALMDAFTGIVKWFISIFPSFTVPSWFTGFGDTFNNFMGGLDGFGVWANWGLMEAVMLGCLAFWLVVLIIKALRWLYGLTPFSGGS